MTSAAAQDGSWAYGWRSVGCDCETYDDILAHRDQYAEGFVAFIECLKEQDCPDPEGHYPIRPVTTEGGRIALTPSLALYPFGSTVTALALAADGYQFIGWEGDLSGTKNPAQVLMDAPKRLLARFSPLWQLHVNQAPGGRVELPPNLEPLGEGTVLRLTAEPDPGFLFAGWTGDHERNQNPLVVLMNRHRSITPRFRPLPLASVPLRISCVAGGDGMELTVANLPGGYFDLEVSEDLVAWERLARIVTRQGAGHYVDHVPVTGRSRFYRAVLRIEGNAGH